MTATITQEDIERARSAVGQSFRHRAPAWNQSNDRSSLSHFAYGYGDTNPLWHSREYGRSTRWHDLIAPPTYLTSAGVDALARYPLPGERVSLAGTFRGTNRLHTKSDWDWFLPVFPGDEVFRSGRFLTSVVERHANGAAAVEQTYETAFINQAGSVIALQTETYLNLVPRSDTTDSSLGDPDIRQNRGPASYSAEDRDRIDRAYEDEEMTGGDTRWWDHVEVGDELPTLTKGPMTVVDIVAMHQGLGWGGMPVGPLRFGWFGRQTSPGYYELDANGVYQVVQQVHWDHEYASKKGFLAPYDYGLMRACWMAHALTNWMGHDAWLWRLTVNYKGLNLLGDTHWVKGTIVDKSIVRDHPAVQVALTGENQTGMVTTTATATVLLASQSEPCVRLPRPTPARETELLCRFDLKLPYLRGSGWDTDGRSLPVPTVRRSDYDTDEESV